MEEIVKIALVGIIGVVISILLRGAKPEFGMVMGLAFSLFVLWKGMQILSQVLLQLQGLSQYLTESNIFLKILLKVVGITYVCEFGSSICKDAGYQSVAQQIDIFGKLSVMLTGMPILYELIEKIQSLL